MRPEINTMNRYMLLEHNRLSTDVAELQQRLVVSCPGSGLKARSVHSFLSQLYRYKKDQLKDLDLRLADHESEPGRLN